MILNTKNTEEYSLEELLSLPKCDGCSRPLRDTEIVLGGYSEGTFYEYYCMECCSDGSYP